MIRRRRRVREIPFSFDSFLDIVANVVGIIIRLILVVWVGARSYSSLQPLAWVPAAASQGGPEVRGLADPLQQELDRHRRELAEARERLLAQLRRLQQSQEDVTTAEGALAALAPQRDQLEVERTALDRTAVERENATQAATLTSAELRRRSQQLAEAIRALEQQPTPTKLLRFRTPVSRPVQSEELLFECNKNRVTFIDIATLLTEVRQGLEEKMKLLKTQWQASDVTSPAGAFRLRYTVERERGLFDALGGDAARPAEGSFRAGLTEWQVEPVAPVRGETAEAALATGSEFRQIVDGIDPQQTAVTFWVYPDSFALFRRLRDFLYERDVTVAGRPLPEGVPIASSRRGSISRGQ